MRGMLTHSNKEKKAWERLPEEVWVFIIVFVVLPIIVLSYKSLKLLIL